MRDIKQTMSNLNKCKCCNIDIKNVNKLIKDTTGKVTIENKTSKDIILHCTVCNLEPNCILEPGKVVMQNVDQTYFPSIAFEEETFKIMEGIYPFLAGSHLRIIEDCIFDKYYSELVFKDREGLVRLEMKKVHAKKCYIVVFSRTDGRQLNSADHIQFVFFSKSAARNKAASFTNDLLGREVLMEFPGINEYTDNKAGVRVGVVAARIFS